jgi:hypothetical protein
MIITLQIIVFCEGLAAGEYPSIIDVLLHFSLGGKVQIMHSQSLMLICLLGCCLIRIFQAYFRGFIMSFCLNFTP